ncbi:MAG: flagellar hook-basal body protein [Oscillibacter sp.]|nr:flagellar hook-basal body protein [Oscillibacter sp.]
MVKGFYNLTSAMLTHGRHLDVISNNMSNAATAGFKSDRFTGSTFENVMWQLVGNKTKNYQDIGEQSWISAPSQLYTDFTQGSLDNTVLPLDFAINGPGYFAIQTGTEETEEEPQFGDWPSVRRGIVYTRAGSFSLDNEGYLTLPNQGRVLSQTFEPIRLVTDQFTTDGYGGLFTTTGGFIGRIGVFTFEDDEAMLEKDDYGTFAAQEEGQPSTTPILNGWLERANIDWVKEMTEMISTQRTYQSAAEALKIYDSVLTRVTQEVGRMS